MSNLNIPSPQDSLDSKLEKLFSTVQVPNQLEVDIPSKGKFYKSAKRIFVTPLLFEDEQRILMSKDRNIDPVNEILSKCVQGIDVADLLEMDKVYLLLKVKEASYGPEYKFSMMCPACLTNCNVSIDVSKQVQIKYVPDDLEDPREVELPVLKVKAKVRFPRNFEQKYISNWEDSITNMYRFVVSLDGDDNPVFISKALKKMHIRDRKFILNEINKRELGLDPQFNFICPYCNHASVIGVPFTASFFSVS